MCVSIIHILIAMAMPKPASCSNNSTVNGKVCNYLSCQTYNMHRIATKFLLFLLLLPQAVMAAETTAPSAREQLIHDVRVWVASQAAVATAQIDIPALDSRMRVTECPPGVRLDFPFPSRTLVRAQCSIPPWQLFIPVAIRPARHILIASRDLAAGSTVTESDLVVRQTSGSEGLENRSAVVGRTLKQALAQGSVVLALNLEDNIKVIRLKLPVKVGSTLTEQTYQIEVLPRAQVPAGAALGVAPTAATRVLADLPAGHLLMATDFSEGRQVLVARQNLTAGRVLEPSLLEASLIYSRDPSQHYFAVFSGLEHAELIHNVRIGEPIRAADVRPATLVRRGHSVLLSVKTVGGLEVSLRAEALQDGKLGDPVQLKNPESGKVTTGIVSGKNAARGL